MGDDLSNFNSAISAAASVINGAASVVGSTFDIDDTKELHEWSHEKAQEWMREDPAISLQGLKNAGLSPVSATGNYFTAGASGSGYPHAPAADKAQRSANFNEALMAADQLKTNQAQRSLINAETEKSIAEADLINSQSTGQKLTNTDYKAANDLFGGPITSTSYNNFVNAKINESSIEVSRLSASLRSAVLNNQINDPDIVSAMAHIPLNEQNRIIADVLNTFQECLLNAEKVNTEKSTQYSNRKQGEFYGASSGAQNALRDYYKAQKDYVEGSQTKLTDQQTENLDVATQAMSEVNPYDLPHAITDINEGRIYEARFWRGVQNYFLNGLFSVLGSGVIAGGMMYSTKQRNANQSDIANMNNNVKTNIATMNNNVKREIASQPKKGITITNNNVGKVKNMTLQNRRAARRKR